MGLAVSPLICHEGDVLGWFVGWAAATHGTTPSDAYTADCISAAIPYLLTAAEAVRRLVGAGATSRLMVVLIKLPNLLAYPLGGLVCWRWLRRPLGDAGARAAGILYLLCAPLFVNAALWGQYEALVCLALLCSVCAAVNEAPVLAGIALGVGLTIKVQAIVLAPVLGIYLLRRFGPLRAGAAVAGALAAIFVITLPHIAAGKGGDVLRGYTTSAGRFPALTLNAWNSWAMVHAFERHVRHLPQAAADSDVRPLLGRVTPKQFGLAMFAAYMAFLAAAMWRRATPEWLMLVSGMAYFAFFMLPTEMHERYIVPAVALFALTAARDPLARGLFVGLSVTASVNQLLVLYIANDPGLMIRHYRVLGTTMLAGSSINLALFAWATVQFHRRQVARISPL